MPDAVNQLLTSSSALAKLGARGISSIETGEIIWNHHLVIRNRKGDPRRRQRGVRRLLIGPTNAGRTLTLVIEETIEPTVWLVVTGWVSTFAERMILKKS